jgi:hypothetical protein
MYAYIQIYSELQKYWDRDKFDVVLQHLGFEIIK